MNYRQWKKNYKKLHGYNPPLEEDKRKQARIARQAVKNLPDYASSIYDAVQTLAPALCNAMSNICEAMSRAFANAGRAFSEAAAGYSKQEKEREEL